MAVSSGSRVSVGVAVLAVLASWCSLDALGGTATTRVSLGSGQAQGNGASHRPSITADGRFVAFESFAANLAAGDSNGWRDVFVRDRKTNKTTRASVASGGKQAHGESWGPSINAADGRFVAFTSSASDLVAGDTNGCWDVFVHDQQTGQTTRVSVASDGTEADGPSYGPSISADGRLVAFTSFASNLVAGDTNGDYDVFVHDRQTGETTRVSVASDGTEADGGSYDPAISADGGFVAFHSFATNLVAGDTNGLSDVFVHNLATGETTRVSVASDGTEGNAPSWEASISGDGRFVAFESDASNLVARDTNGCGDVFMRDLQRGLTTRVSVAFNGKQGNAASASPAIGSDSSGLLFMAFESDATHLVAHDTNGRSDVFVRQMTPDAPLPDLQGCFLAAPGSVRWGQLMNVAFQIKNAGDAAAGRFSIEWYLSQDTVGSTVDDLRLGRPDMKATFYGHLGIAAGAKGPIHTLALLLPPGRPSGWSGTNFYLIMRTDSTNEVDESNEKNNFGQMGDGLDRVPITITAP